MKKAYQVISRMLLLGAVAGFFSCESMLGDMEYSIASIKKQMLFLFDFRPLPQISLFNGASQVKPGELIDMGTTYMDTSKTISLKIRNSGAVSLSINAIDVTGAYRSRFQISDITFPARLAPDNEVSFTVAFTGEYNDGFKAAVVSINAGEEYMPFNVTVACERMEEERAIMEVSIEEQPGNFLDLDSGATYMKTVGRETSFTFTITNTGTAPLEIKNACMSDSSPLNEFQIYADEIPSDPIAKDGGIAEVVVHFDYPAAGLYTDTLTIEYFDGITDPVTYTLDLNITATNDPVSHIVVLKGTDVMSNPGADDFNTQPINTTTEHVYRIRNFQATGNLEIQNISISGDDADEFAFPGSTSFSIAPGNSSDISVNYHPTSVGTHTATLTIESNSQENSSFAIVLSGTSIRPYISIGPDSDKDFGALRINQLSEPRDFSIANNGDATLHIYAIQVSGEQNFIVDPQLGSYSNTTLSKGQTIPFTVTYQPTSFGTHDLYITVISDDPDNSACTFHITGHTIDIAVYQKDSSDFIESGIAQIGHDFNTVSNDGSGKRTSGYQYFTISNNGKGLLTVSGIGIDNAAFHADTSSMQIPAGGSGTFGILFDPTTTAALSGTVTITSDNADIPSYTYNVTGDGIAPTLLVTVAVNHINIKSNNDTLHYRWHLRFWENGQEPTVAYLRDPNHYDYTGNASWVRLANPDTVYQHSQTFVVSKATGSNLIYLEITTWTYYDGTETAIGSYGFGITYSASNELTGQKVADDDGTVQNPDSDVTNYAVHIPINGTSPTVCYCRTIRSESPYYYLVVPEFEITALDNDNPNPAP